LEIVFFIVSIVACIGGSICGIGVGAITKPVLELTGYASVPAVNFLSGCMVLGMAVYSVVRSSISHDNKLDYHTSTPLGIGAAAGELVGTQIYTWAAQQLQSASRAGLAQSLCMMAVSLGALVYILKREKIRTLHVAGWPACLAIGVALGVVSNLFGIGAGPLNMVVLFFFFSMDAKTAAQNSFYIILFGQAVSLLGMVITHSVPDVHPLTLVLMVLGGVLGDVVGRAVRNRMDDADVRAIFAFIMLIIFLFCSYNVWQYSHAG
jgi:hypothetical protein